ncbi:MAG: TolC family outer membrane protein, partial [Rickettsiales bacterium]|nr:TolC family outer membrane protein [Rickettsiales bacterium]
MTSRLHLCLLTTASLLSVALTPVMAAHAQQAEAPAKPSSAATTAAESVPEATPSTGMLPDTLQKALAHTYQTNPEIKSQRKSLEQLDESVNQALSGFLPSASFDYSTGRQRNRFNDGTFTYSDNKVKQLTVEQPLFRGGETLAQTSSAENNVEAGRADLKNVEQEILLRAITAYMDVVRDRSVLELSHNNSDVLRKQLKASKERFDVGEITRTDVAQSEARLARAENDVIQAKGALTNSVANFERVVGYTPEDLAVPENFPEIPANVDEAISLAQEFNPALVSADFSQKSADDVVDVNIARILPDVSLRGSIRREQGAGLIGNADFDSDSVLLNVNVPLYQSGAEYSRVRASKARRSEARF